MNILLVSTAFGTKAGGLGNRALTLAEAWTDMGVNVTVLTAEGQTPRHRYSVKSVALPGHYLLRAMVLCLWLIRQCIRQKVDGIFCISWSPEGLAALAAGRLFRIPWVVSANGFDVCDALQKGHVRRLARLVFNGADVVVSPSQFLKRQILRLGGINSRIQVVSNGVNMQLFFPGIDGAAESRKRKKRSAAVLLSVGRLHPIKGLDTLIEAFAGLVDDHPDTKLTIAGSGPEKKSLLRQVQRFGVSDRVEFIGWIAQKNLPELYRAADIVILPSRKMGDFEEGQGIALLEAAACGKPAVGTRSGGIPEVIMDHETGLLAAPDDATDLRSKIRYLLERPALCEKLGENAAKLAKEKFDGKLNARKILQNFPHCAGDKRP